MGFSVADAMSAYGFVYQLANSVPDLKKFLDQAVKDKWEPNRLKAQIESSPWWMQHAETTRNLVIQQATEPGAYNRNIANATQQVWLKAQQLGRKIDHATAQRLALRTLTENFNWDDQRLSLLVADSTQLARGEGDSYQGTAAQYSSHMAKVAEDYGVPHTSAWLDSWVSQVESGRNTLDAFDAVVKARAKAAFPHFATQIDAGMTVRDIADPYIQTYAKTLEVPETGVKLNDTAIQRALSQHGPDGTTRTAMPLWQFERQIKDDPRYDKTKQAREDAYGALGKIGSAFGFYTGSN